MRRLAALLIALTTLSACSGGARVAEPPPPAAPTLPPPVQTAPPPAPEPPESPEPSQPDVIVPAPELRAPRGTVQSRAYYAEADVTEWVLATGATVVFKPLPNGGQVRLLGVAPSLGMVCEARITADLASGDLAGLFEASLGPRAVYVVVGDARPGEVEQAAARLLTLAPTVNACAPDASGFLTSTTEPDEAAALAVLVEVLRARGTQAFARTANGRTTLGGAAADLAALRPTDAELATARAAAARRPETAAFWLDALTALYTAPGDVRPPGDPSLVARFPARVARISSRAVADLAARFAAPPAAPSAN